MSIRAVIFDLDDTLILDEAATRQAFAAAARRATHFGAAEKTFFADAVQLAASLWRAGGHADFCERIGINDAECLWGDFGDEPPWSDLQHWAEGFRLEVFDQALRRQMIENAEAPRELAGIFARTRRQKMRLMPDALEVLARLEKQFALGLLTNGAPRLQQEKIDLAGLRGFFSEIMVSGEQGVGKPQPEIFHRLLEQMKVKPKKAVMVGNSMTRDIAGGRAAGMHTVWFEVPGAEEPAEVTPDHTIKSLSQLPGLLEEL